ncbi:hypothetical protein GCM10020219_053610 [Nonomuraea dietziae]
MVLYGGNNNWFAAYAYWYFKLYGHSNVKLLDGGRKKCGELRLLAELVTDRARPCRDDLHRRRSRLLDPLPSRDDVVNAIGKLNAGGRPARPTEFTRQALLPGRPATGVPRA